MSSVNPHYTFEYVQPEEYRFSHDSVFLARRAFEHVKEQTTKQVLDLCSGCGVVGMDFLFYLAQDQRPLPSNIDFIEVQNIYADYFVKNISTLLKQIGNLPSYNFINLNYNQMLEPRFKEKYDLILCNPPYFRKEHGVQSASEFKNRCRFFLDSDFAGLVHAMGYSLAPNGRAFVLLKSLEEHGIDIEKEFYDHTKTLKLYGLGLVRDTNLYQITRI